MKAWISIVALAAGLSFGAASAEAAPSVAKACAKDIKSVCADVKSGGGKLKACVKEHYSELSTECQIAIVKVAAVGRACKADAKKLCSDLKPGKNRVAECLQSHTADLSDGCKDALTKAEAGSR
ncbi:cysteine rich repeat protein [Roseiarcus fermentans]|uniref:Cysteine rich repeat protein n=1 Tax=Roseiarcus fermentans TaxID=1473586 RepID=A0A366FVB2_9HYPH|nr:cysteine rich repeat-containing protein [Roseiarcus fermentans]RBP17685.1 cysteine rich repeat protein [Roseiarcus fermentans]